MFAAPSAPSPVPQIPLTDQGRALQAVVGDARRMRASAAEAGLSFARDRLAGIAEAASKLLLIGRGQVAFGGVRSLMNSAISAMDALGDAAVSPADRGRIRDMLRDFDSLGTRLSALAAASARSEDERREAAGFQARLRTGLAKLRDAAG